jgi:hypothetical protein
MDYGLLADLVVAVHVAYVSYVVLGQLLIMTGAALGWRWTLNPWFRWSHVIAIVIVGFEAICGIDCPLTVWEGDLRRLAGQEPSDMSFLGRCMGALIFFDAPVWLLNAIHVGFAVLVVGTLIWIPPRWPRRH